MEGDRAPLEAATNELLVYTKKHLSAAVTAIFASCKPAKMASSVYPFSKLNPLHGHTTSQLAVVHKDVRCVMGSIPAGVIFERC